VVRQPGVQRQDPSGVVHRPGDEGESPGPSVDG
jgi:hypothetical protein